MLTVPEFFKLAQDHGGHLGYKEAKDNSLWMLVRYFGLFLCTTRQERSKTKAQRENILWRNYW